MREQRGDAQFICFEEGSPRTLDASLPFMKHLPVESESLGGASKGVKAAEEGGDDADVKGFKKSLLELQVVVCHTLSFSFLSCLLTSYFLLATCSSTPPSRVRSASCPSSRGSCPASSFAQTYVRWS